MIEFASARAVLDDAEATFERLGHENLGFLSETHGFLPRLPPLLALPAAYAPWDDLGASLPNLIRTRSLCDAVDRMPVLSADELPDGALLRSSTLLSILAHAYHRADRRAAPVLPRAISEPWEVVNRRLGRRMPVLSYIDLIVYNWRFLDERGAGPMRSENLRLLVPTVDNAEERTFYLAQVEILAGCTPILGAVVRAHEAVLARDRDLLAAELVRITDCLRDVTVSSLAKIDPNPEADSYVDPVIWAKTVAPLAVPITPGVQGPGGTASPIFHLLDVFFGRATYESFLGKEMIALREWYPEHWRRLLAAVASVSCADHVRASGSRLLTALYREALEAYAGDHGFLGRHRLKVYGYLDLAFKVGRTLTIGGFSGIFKDRTWDRIDNELERSRSERDTRQAPFHHHLRRSSITPADEAGSAMRVALDVAGLGLRPRPGDRCAVLPEHGDDLVERTLRALRARGDETVRLDMRWRQALAARPGHAGGTELPLRTLLRFGRIRPITRDVAKMLGALSGNERLRRIVDARQEDQWELWDVLELLARSGFDPSVLWQAHPAEPESICRAVPPESARYYSVASGDGVQTALDLTVGLLRYEAHLPDGDRATRTGTASRFLTGDDLAGTIPFRVVPATTFRLPDDHRQPIVMFAGGTGVSPFRAFLHERSRHADAGPAWLFYAARTRSQIHYRDELEALVRRGALNLRYALSHDPAAPSRIGDVILAEENRLLLRHMLEDRSAGGGGAAVYVCGGAGFASAVTAGLATILGEQPDSRLTLPRLAAQRRLLREVFTTYTVPTQHASAELDASEVALHNDDRHGWWIVVDGRVYDITDFQHLHAGGVKVLRGYAGMDATAAYRAVRHDADPSVDSVRTLYEIGVVRRLDFGSAWGVSVGERGIEMVALSDLYRLWVRLLYLVVEMQNAQRNDLSIREGSTTGGEQPWEVSPFKSELLHEVHRRFLLNYVQGLDEPLGVLWGRTCGVCSRSEDVRWLSRRLESCRATAAAQLVATCANDDHQPSIDAINARDGLFLEELKFALCAGLRLFELHQRSVVGAAGERLLAVARDLPTIMERWYADIAAMLA